MNNKKLKIMSKEISLKKKGGLDALKEKMHRRFFVKWGQVMLGHFPLYLTDSSSAQTSSSLAPGLDQNVQKLDTSIKDA